jgi:hypothetical protein
MHTRAVAAIAALALAAGASAHTPSEPSVAATDVVIKPARPGVVRVHHPANHAWCRWSAPAHEHSDAAAPRGVSANVTSLIENGPSANRIDLVVVGDGYAAGELPLYAQHAQRGIDELFALAPFDQYVELFNVHRVDVVSNESGVDDDPRGVDRDTALDMRFWCAGVERLLCVSVSAARAYANLAPGADQIFAVANSTTYGGAGYPTSDVATYSGGSSFAPWIAIHELGHSLGNLADEYAYGGPDTYTGPEPAARNVSTLDASAMLASGAKWAPWLGESSPVYDDPVSTYEGANMSAFDVYRPTPDSLMRNLARPLNAPSAEGLIIEMWKIVAPIDAAAPAGTTIGRTQTASVTPAASFLTVRWTLDGALVGVGPSLDLRTITIPPGGGSLRATVVDETSLVRDEASRAAYMTQTREWSIVPNATPADLNGDGVVDGADLAALIGAWGGAGGDVTGDGATDAQDLAALIAAWG